MTLKEVIRVVEWIRVLDPDMPVQTLSALLYVGVHGPCSQAELSQHLGMSQSTASRNIATLGKRHRLGKPGLDLIISQENPEDRRYKILSLTPKGRKLIQSLQQILNQDLSFEEKEKLLHSIGGIEE